MNPSLHQIQYEILERLRLHPRMARYAQLRPTGVENDLFNYHLQQLVKLGYIARTATGYELSRAGSKLLMEINPIDDGGRSHHFKLAAMCIVWRGGPGGIELLWQERLRQPFMGQLAPIGGGMLRGEPAVEAAKRRVLQEAGVAARSFSLVGLVRKYRYDDQQALLSDILFHVCLGEYLQGPTHMATNDYGRHFWVSPAEAAKLERSSPAGSPELADWLESLNPTESGPMFYLENPIIVPKTSSLD